jgi:hypothetical protein
MRLQVRDLDPLKVAITWARSHHPKTRIAGNWIDKILDECPATEDDSSISTEGVSTMFYIIGKAGVLHGVAATKKEVDADFAQLEEGERLESIVANGPEDLAATLSIKALLELGNSEDVLKGGPEFVKFKNKQDGAAQVWEVLEQGHNPKLIAAAEKAAKAAEKEAAKAKAAAEKEAAKAARSKEKAETKPKGERGPRSSFAGKNIKVLDKDTTKFREGSWTRYMAEVAVGSKTTDEAQGKVDTHAEYKGKRVDFAWLAAKGIVETHA